MTNEDRWFWNSPYDVLELVNISVTEEAMLLDELFEERAAIKEYDGNMPRWEAEQSAAQELGFSNMAELKSYVQQLKASNEFLENRNEQS